MLRFRYRGNQASSVVDICMKCGRAPMVNKDFLWVMYLG